MPTRPPHFPFYVNDFSSDGLVEAMTTEEVGAYILLLCKAWLERPAGSIPNDDRILARWSRMSDEGWAKAKISVLCCFKLEPDGRFHQKRMKKEHKAMMDRKKERSESGSYGAAKRWHSHSSAINQPMAKNSSSSSSSSSSYNIDISGKSGERLHGIPKDYQEVIEFGKTLTPSVPESVCRAFFDHYESQRKTGPSGEIFWTKTGGEVLTHWKGKLPYFKGSEAFGNKPFVKNGVSKNDKPDYSKGF